MNNLKFVPEGWNNETTKLTKDNIKIKMLLCKEL